MSILLEALRKSEKKQRSRDVPTIHSEVPSYEPSGRSSRLSMILVLAITLVVSGWLVWQQYRPPDNELVSTGGADPGISSQPDESSNNDTVAASEPVLQVNDTSGETDSAVNELMVADASQPSAPPPGLRENDRGPRPRTPMENYQPPVPDGSNKAVEKEGGEPKSSPGPDQTQQLRQSGFTPKNKLANAPGPEASDQGDPAGPENIPREPAPITYWQLPDAIRADVPEIKYSVLVYDKDPAERFILINGERFREGDIYQPGLVVKEVRRDGVIFSYRLYQFLVER